MTYKEIEKVNSEITAIDVKGRNYADVPQRIKAFRKLFPDGFIKSEIVNLADGVVVIKAEAGFYDADGKETVLGTGLAYEKEGSSFINKTSYIENCETSAVGRALGMIGLGIDTSVASYEEVANAINQQEVEKVRGQVISENKFKVLQKMCQTDKVDIYKLCDLYNVKSLSELTEEKFVNINSFWAMVKESCK